MFDTTVSTVKISILYKKETVKILSVLDKINCFETISRHYKLDCLNILCLNCFYKKSI